MASKLNIKLIRSRIGYSQKHRKILDGLGLKKMHSQVVREDTPATRGMIEKVSFMLEVKEI